MLIAIGGCAQRETQMQEFGIKEAASPVDVTKPVEPVHAPPQPSGPPIIQEIRLGTSVQGRPIDIIVFGETDATPVLVMGAIHGDEQTTADLTRGLIGLLRTQRELFIGKRVAVIAVANPDGYASDSRLNANGVDVNRNFPASNYRTTAPSRASTRPRYGASASSEPETRAILKALDTINPRLLISIHSITNGRQCNNYDGPAKTIAELMSAKNGYPAAANIGYPTPGSLGSYAGIDRQIPMITLELPRDLPGDQAWTQNRAALVAAIQGTK